MGAGIKEQFSDVFLYDIFGIVTGTAGAYLPNVPCGIARFKALPGNIGPFFIGQQSGSSFTTFPLSANDDTGWFATSNLNRYYARNPSGTSNYMAFWVQR